MRFFQMGQRMHEARQCLMLPHPKGEITAIADALARCADIRIHLDIDALDDNARAWVLRLQELMDVQGLSDPTGVGVYAVRAQSLTLEDLYDLARIVDDLASWFDERTLDEVLGPVKRTTARHLPIERC